jgi:hypothetical protein
MGNEFGAVHWFGEPWDAPVCDEAARVKVPVDKECDLCMVTFLPTDQGITVPHLSEFKSVGRSRYHLTCWVRCLGLAKPLSALLPAWQTAVGTDTPARPVEAASEAHSAF